MARQIIHDDDVAGPKLRHEAMLCKAGERTVSALWDIIGKLADIFQPEECTNYFSSCGYEPE